MNRKLSSFTLHCDEVTLCESVMRTNVRFSSEEKVEASLKEKDGA